MVATPLAAPAVNDVTFDESNTSWGNGQGTSGEVLSPKNLAELGDLISSLEFKASISGSDVPIQSSSIEAKVYVQGNGSTVGGSSTNLWNNFYKGESYQGQTSYEEDNNFVIEFGESTKNLWGERNFIRSIADAGSQNSDFTTDENGYDAYAFVEPEHIRLDSIISGYGFQVDRANPGVSNIDISEGAELTIGLTSDIIAEVVNLRDSSKIEIEQSNIAAWGTPDGNNTLSVRIANFVDDEGNIDFQQLNSSVDINLDLDVDITDKFNQYTEVNAYAQLRGDSSNSQGYTPYLSLRSGDQESSSNDTYTTAATITGDGIDVIDFDDGTQGTRIEFIFDTWGINNAYANLDNGESEVSYTLDYASLNINGFDSSHLDFKDSSAASEGLTTLILDFDGYTPPSGGEQDYELVVTPASNVIDFSRINELTEALNFSTDGLDHSHFGVSYQIISDENGSNVGNINLNAHIDNLYGNSNNSINGYIDDQDADLDSLTTRFSSLNLNAAGNGSNDHLHLSFSFNEETNSYQISSAGGSDFGIGLNWNTESALSNLELLPEGIQFDWNDFTDLSFKNFNAVALDQDVSIAIDTYLSSGDGITPPEDASIHLSYNLYQQDSYLNDYDADAINQLAVLGDSVNQDSRYVLDINAQSLEDDFNIESTDITIAFNPQLFGSINASDVKIGGELPLANAVYIDNEAGTIRLAASSLSDLGQGSGLSGSSDALASISLNFDESQIQYLEKNPDGSLKISPLTFDITVNEQETVFSNTFIDASGFKNREILTLDDLGGGFAVDGQEVTLYEAQINLEQQGDGLVLGTERVIGADAAFTNLVRKGDTIATSTDWLNVGNIVANDLTYSEIYNENASISFGSASFSKSNIASGSFIEGEFVKDARESTTFTADIEITGEAGNVVDLSDGIVSVHAQGTSDVFTNEGLGSSNLITYQGDLNYDGRVSMKDLAFLNAGAARQQVAITGNADDFNADGIVDASVARDVDADFSGKIDIADLAILDSDWGKTLHTGDEQFQGSSDVSWTALDSQGNGTSWNNDSFKDQNSIEAEIDYVGSLESPASTGVIGADGNETANDGDIQGSEFQDPLAA